MAFQLEAEIAESDFAWTIGSFCQLNRVPFDPALLLQKFPAPHSCRQLIEALRSFGFRTGEGKIAKSAYPCLGFVAGDVRKLALLVKRDAERLLYFVAGTQTPQTAPVKALKEHFDPDVLLVRHETAKEPANEDGAPAASKFGFRWFWTELIRHKRIWRDVLLASFFIQLIGLTTPIGTQVIIDKVVVHQTESTLIAIAVGLGMFLLFSAGMSWLRQDLRTQEHVILSNRALIEQSERKISLSPGMQVSSEISLGTRTILEYVLSPVQKAWHEAGRER